MIHLCLVVPHYNHTQAFANFLPRLAALKLPCIVVDDGSTSRAKSDLLELLSAYPDIELVEHQNNRGKGAAMWTGAHRARHRQRRLRRTSFPPLRRLTLLVRLTRPNMLCGR